MTFKSRMLEPTGAEEPRWLYLVRKVWCGGCVVVSNIPLSVEATS